MDLRQAFTQSLTTVLARGGLANSCTCALGDRSSYVLMVQFGMQWTARISLNHSLSCGRMWCWWADQRLTSNPSVSLGSMLGNYYDTSTGRYAMNCAIDPIAWQISLSANNIVVIRVYWSCLYGRNINKYSLQNCWPQNDRLPRPQTMPLYAHRRRLYWLTMNS